MYILAVIQTQRESGEKHVAFSTDPTCDPKDLMVCAGPWLNSDIKIGKLLVVDSCANDSFLEALGSNDFFTEIDPVVFGEVDSERIRQLVKAALEKN